MSRSKTFCPPLAKHILLAAALWSTAAPAQTARPMAVLQQRYEVRAGEPAPIALPVETLDFLLHAKSQQIAIQGADTTGLVVAPSVERDRILLAPSPLAKPGEYAVTLSATSDDGEQRQTTLSVSVKPHTTVPNNATRNPVVLLNGWQTGFYNSCPVSTSSSATFGNLAQYLVSDGVPVVYLFDNCAVDPGQTIEVLARDLDSFLNSIKYDSGTQVPQIDLVAFSMGGLIARAYLSGIQSDQSYLPPSPTLVGKMVLIATPNFGSYTAGNYLSSLTGNVQDLELAPGSSLLWNLATWNQHGDDLRGVSTVAIAGNAGLYNPSLSLGTSLTNAGDGLVSLTSASAGFIAPATYTRVLPYCHVDPGTFVNTLLGTFQCNAPGIANVTSTSHPTGQIVRSFLAGKSDWSTIGTAASADPYLSSKGGMFFALLRAAGTYVSDLTGVTFGTVGLQNGGNAGTIFYTDFVSGTGTFVAASQSMGSLNCGSLTQAAGYSWALRCKLGPLIYSVTPLAGSGGFTVAAGASVTLNGSNLGAQCNGCQVLLYPQGSSTAQALTVNSWQNQAISVKLPAGVTGLVTLKVLAAGGNDAIGVMAAQGSTIAVAPTSLAFAAAVGGTAPAAQTIQITNTGIGTLSFAAKASDSWISISPTSGTAPSTLSVSVSPKGLAAGTYNGSVDISAAGASNSPLSVPVTLTVEVPTATLSLSSPSLSFQYTAGGPAAPAQDVSVTNSTSGSVSWTAAADSFWIVLSPASGSSPGTLTVSVNGANLAPGSYTGNVTVTPGDPTVAAASLSVSFTVDGTQPAGTVTSVVSAAIPPGGIASGTWISIFGTNLSLRTGTWQPSDFVNGALPTSLQGVSVTINGIPAYVEYISPTQINALTPDDAATGPVAVQVTTAGQASNSVTVQKSALAPAFLTFDGSHAAARHADFTPVGSSDILPGTPAQPGETLLFYGIGFGPTNPAQPTGQQVTAAAPLAVTPQITIGGQPATVVFAGLVQPGLYQFNVTIPTLPKGDAAVAATIGGVSVPSGVVVTVQP